MDRSLQNQDVSITTVILIHWSLFASVFIYGGIAYTISTILDKAPANASLFELWVIVMSVVSLMVFTSVLFFRKYWLAPEALTDLDTSDQAEGQYVTAMIVQGGLIESIAIYGLILCILFKSFLLFLPYGVVSLILFIVFRPSWDDLQQRLKRAGWSSDQESNHETES